MPIKGAPMIRWNGDEIQAVFLAAQELWSRKPHLDVRRLVLEAQAVLPLNRRKKLPATHTVNPQLRAMLTKIKPSALERVQPSASPEGTTAMVEVQVPSSLEAALDTLCEELALRIASRLQFHLKQRAAAVVGNAALSATAGDRAYRRKVMLIGGNSTQHGEIHKAFDKLLDLRTVESSGRNTSHWSVPQARDFQGLVVVWTDFVPHSVYSGIQAEKLVQVAGGITSVKEKLEEIYCMT